MCPGSPLDVPPHLRSSGNTRRRKDRGVSALNERVETFEDFVADEQAKAERLGLCKAMVEIRPFVYQTCGKPADGYCDEHQEPNDE